MKEGNRKRLKFGKDVITQSKQHILPNRSHERHLEIAYEVGNDEGDEQNSNVKPDTCVVSSSDISIDHATEEKWRGKHDA